MRESLSAKALHDGGESKALLRASDAARQIGRRLFLKQGLSLGALTFVLLVLGYGTGFWH